jgi:transcriptional antiterminator RfaH
MSFYSAELDGNSKINTAESFLSGCLSWYCIRSQPKHEHIAAANLRQIPGVTVFNPRLRIIRQTRRGQVCLIEPLFPNYLFAQFVPCVSLEKVRYAPGVSMVVHFGTRMPVIPDEVIDDLRRCVDEQNNATYFEASLNSGDEVEISSGAFQGAQGVVQQVLPAKQRVRVLLEIMGRETSIELSLNSIFCEKPIPAQFILGRAGANAA